MDPEPFVGIERAAEHLGVKVSWLYEQVRPAAKKTRGSKAKQKNPPPSYKRAGFRFFKLSELDAWVRGEQSSNGNGVTR